MTWVARESGPGGALPEGHGAWASCALGGGSCIDLGRESGGETHLLGVKDCAEEARDGEEGLVEAEDEPVEPREGGVRMAVAEAGHGVGGW